MANGSVPAVVHVLVERVLKLHKDLPKVRTPHEREAVRRQIAVTGKQIDQHVDEPRRQ